MGLLDFASDLGRKLFEGDDDAAERIKAHIEENNPGIDNLEVSFQGGFVNISGDCKDPEALEKAILMAGNVKGVTKVTTNISFPDETGTAEFTGQEGVEYYVIESGDTLSGIAKRFYGKAMDYPRIFEANREVIKDPDLIFVGQKIRIPLN